MTAFWTRLWESVRILFLVVVATPSTPADLHQCANAVLAVDPLPSTDTKGVELKDDVIVIREFEIEPRTL